MARGGRAEVHGPHSDVSFRLDQKTDNFKAAFPSRGMQRSLSTEEKKKNQLVANRVSLHKNNNNNNGEQLPAALRLYISGALEQKTANFKVALHSRVMQWSALTEEKQKN